MSTAVEAAAAAFAGVLAVLPRPVRWRMLALAALLAFLSADDILALHDRLSIEQLGPIPHASRLVWPLVFGPILVLTGFLLVLAVRRAAVAVRQTVYAGLVSLVAAVVLEAATPILFALGFGHGSAPYELEVVVEEGLELAGFVRVATGLAALVVGDVAGPGGGARGARAPRRRLRRPAPRSRRASPGSPRGSA